MIWYWSMEGEHFTVQHLFLTVAYEQQVKKDNQKSVFKIISHFMVIYPF